MNNKLRRLILAAILLALTLALNMLGIGLIPLGFINVTILCLPVIIGTLTVGLPTGLLLGGVFGLFSTLSAFGALPANPPSTLALTLMGQSPLLVVVMCMLPRLVLPVTTWFVARAMQKRPKTGVGVAAAVGSLTNTVLYLGLMLLFYALTGLDTASILALIAGTGAIAGSAEAIVAVIICTPVVLAVRKAVKF